MPDDRTNQILVLLMAVSALMADLAKMQRDLDALYAEVRKLVADDLATTVEQLLPKDATAGNDS
jgi:hypothetical protein